MKNANGWVDFSSPHQYQAGLHFGEDFFFLRLYTQCSLKECISLAGFSCQHFRLKSFNVDLNLENNFLPNLLQCCKIFPDLLGLGVHVVNDSATATAFLFLFFIFQLDICKTGRVIAILVLSKVTWLWQPFCIGLTPLKTELLISEVLYKSIQWFIILFVNRVDSSGQKQSFTQILFFTKKLDSSSFDMQFRKCKTGTGFMFFSPLGIFQQLPHSSFLFILLIIFQFIIYPSAVRRSVDSYRVMGFRFYFIPSCFFFLKH